ncbi:MAG: peroxiredoxin [Betaproteobacteria bacterium]
MLQVGSRAPVFELPDASMEMIQLSSFRGKKNVVLYFYPRDGTPGCTLEAINFSDQDNLFAECDTIVFGVSRDDCLVHEEFRDKHGLSLQLLSDTDCEVMKKYEVMTEQPTDGTTRPCVHRSTFVIDKKGVVRHILRDLNPREHASEVLKLVRLIHGH